MRIKVEKDKIYDLTEEQIYDLLELDKNKTYKLKPDFYGILNLLNNIFNGPSKINECYLSYREFMGKELVLQKEDGSEIMHLTIMHMEINKE